MQKDFDNWNKRKKKINAKERYPTFNEREIWWCSIGVNVGFEQDGKGKMFSRPVLVLKKYNRMLFVGIPLTSQSKKGKWYLDLGVHKGTQQTLLISQIRVLSAARLIRNMYTLPDSTYRNIGSLIKIESNDS